MFNDEPRAALECHESDYGIVQYKGQENLDEAVWVYKGLYVNKGRVICTSGAHDEVEKGSRRTDVTGGPERADDQ